MYIYIFYEKFTFNCNDEIVEQNIKKSALQTLSSSFEWTV